MAGYTEIEAPPISPQQWSAENGGEEAPHHILKAWRGWADRENDWIHKQAERMSGMSTNEMLEEMGYENEVDKGKSVFSRFNAGERAGHLEQSADAAFDVAVDRGHMTWDPVSKVFYNQGKAAPGDYGGYEFWDSNKKRTSMPKGFTLAAQPTAPVVPQNPNVAHWKPPTNTGMGTNPVKPTNPDLSGLPYERPAPTPQENPDLSGLPVEKPPRVDPSITPPTTTPSTGFGAPLSIPTTSPTTGFGGPTVSGGILSVKSNPITAGGQYQTPSMGNQSGRPLGMIDRNSDQYQRPKNKPNMGGFGISAY